MGTQRFLLPFFKSAREQPPPTFNPICIVLVTDGPFEDQNDTKTKSIKTNMCNCKLKEQSRYQEQDKKRSSWSNLKTTTKKKNLKNYMKKVKKGCVHCIDTPCKVELCVEPLHCNNALWIGLVALAASSNEKPRTGLEQKCNVHCMHLKLVCIIL